MASCGGRGGQLPGPSSGREANCPHVGRVPLLPARVFLQLAGRWADVLGRHSYKDWEHGERHHGSGPDT